MSDEKLIRLLQTLSELALLPYPFPDGSNCDERLVLALGQIAGMAHKAISEVAKSRTAAI